MKILPEVYLYTAKSPLNFESHMDPDLWIWTRDLDWICFCRGLHCPGALVASVSNCGINESKHIVVKYDAYSAKSIACHVVLL